MTSARRHKLTRCPWVLCHHAASLPFRWQAGLLQICCFGAIHEQYMASAWTTASTRSLDKWQHRAEGKAIYKGS